MVFIIYSISLARAQTLIDLKTRRASLEVAGRMESEKMGRALTVGDFNGDGFDDIIIGAPFEVADSTKARVYVVFGSDNLPSKIDLILLPADLEIIAAQPADGMGTSGLLLDVNLDGKDDLLIGAPFSSINEKQKAGRVYVIFGRPAFPGVIDLSESSADITILGESLDDNFGFALASGDITGDKLLDLIVGAQGATTPNGVSTGKVYAFFLLEGANGDVEASSLVSIQVYGKDDNDRIGYAVGSGNLNNDAFDDLIIGSFKRNVSISRIDAGETYVIFGLTLSGSLVIDLKSQDADVTLSGGKTRDHLGISVNAGDVNGDMIDDLIVGARQAENGTLTNAGAAVIFFGSSNWPLEIDLQSDSPDVKIIGEESSALLGSTVSSGDLNGDGVADVILGAPFGGAADRFGAGKSYVIYGGANLNSQIDLFSQSADITILGEDSLDLSGVAFAVGDVNNDGLNDLIVGAEDAGSAGKCYVLLADLITTVSSSGTDESIPAEFRLHQNYPNPFNAGTTFRFDVKSGSGAIKLKIFDVRGREIKTLFSGTKEPGTYTVRWDGGDDSGRQVSSGLYLAVLKSKLFRQTRKAIFLK